MAGRRLSRQQQKRIRAAQQAHSESDEYRRGLVVSHQGGQVLVEMEPGAAVECKIKSNLGAIVCGDRVSIETTSRGESRVVAIVERDNLLRRVDGYGQVRAVAANVTRLLVCLAIRPEPNLLLLDQYLLSAEQQAIDACIVLNKIDLAEDPQDPFELRRIYRPMDYTIVATSVKTGAGMEEFSQLLAGQVSVLGGVSGVGKSSLTSWLLPDEDIRIGELSAASEEGRHTTRASRLYHLAGGGDLIDTPGVRGFSPFIDASTPLAAGFREIQAMAAGCRFHNCLHRGEPGCAVAAALEAGSIAPGRYRNYLKLLEQS